MCIRDRESDGTRRLFDLMDMLLNKREDVLYVVDELERSLHPKLTERFLQLFMQLHDEQRMQLLFTTHCLLYTSYRWTGW